jgi:hypothetical protein
MILQFLLVLFSDNRKIFKKGLQVMKINFHNFKADMIDLNSF